MPTEFITATNIKYYWICPSLFELVYIKKSNPLSGQGRREGEVFHNIVLNTVRDLQEYEHPALEKYQAILKRKVFEHRMGMEAGSLKDFQKSMTDRTIFDRLGIGIEDVAELKLEESFYSKDPKVHAMPDIVFRGDVYDLKTGKPPSSGVSAPDCVSTAASALPVAATYHNEPRVFVVYTRSDDGPREVSYQQWLPEVRRCITGIQAMEFPKNKASPYCSRCSCGKTNPL